MCRIFFSPSKKIVYEPASLHRFFLQLEKIGGGDGNGVYLFKTNELNRSIEEMPFIKKPKGIILFHTRKATNGKVATYNCQPFIGNRYILVHNGIFSGITSYAKLLGFPFSSEKYSDSYLMHWVIEKVGIFNFYNGFLDKYYGVILVYDKKTKQMFLLKTGGIFSWANIKSNNKYIYGSEALEFWKLVKDPEFFSSGLYRLEENKFVILYKPKKIYYNTTYYGRNWERQDDWYDTYRNKKWDNVNKKWIDRNATTTNDNTTNDNKKLCDYCGLLFPKYGKRFKEYGYEICESCNILYGKNDEPIGIGALFGDVPKECHSCNWLKNGKCWFGGTKRNKFRTVLSGEELMCNTKDDKMDMVIECEKCQTALTNTDLWGINGDGLITCKDCVIKERRIERYLARKKFEEQEKILSCESCHFLSEKMDFEPCHSCISKETGKFDNWTEPEIELGLQINEENDCDNCLYDELSAYDEPCKTCRLDQTRAYLQWEPKTKLLDIDGTKEMDYVLEKCWYCGYHFDEETDEPLYDKKGHRICHDCDEFGEGIQWYKKGG